MPYRTFGAEEAARYLHLSRADLERLVKDQDIPFQKRGERLAFSKVQIDAWATQRILRLQGRGLAEYHQRSSQATGQVVPHEAIMPELIRPESIEPALAAKTKPSVLREMAALAEKTGCVCNPQELRSSLEAREELCSTAIPGGLALLHARSPDSYLFESPFIVLGRTAQEIHFGSPDGQPTRLFFLLGCPSERLHLHTLARLCLMAQKTPLLAELQQAADAAAMRERVLAAEEAVLK